MGYGKRATSALEYIESRYVPEPTTGCWLWTATLAKRGGSHGVAYTAMRNALDGRTWSWV